MVRNRDDRSLARSFVKGEAIEAELQDPAKLGYGRQYVMVQKIALFVAAEGNLQDLLNQRDGRLARARRRFPQWKAVKRGWSGFAKRWRLDLQHRGSGGDSHDVEVRGRVDPGRFALKAAATLHTEA